MSNTENRRVLFVSYRFPPQNIAGSIRAIKFMKYLARYGWHVDVMVPEGSVSGEFETDLLDSKIRLIPVPCPNPLETLIRWRARLTPKRKGLSKSVSTNATPPMKRRLSSLFVYPDEAVWWGPNLTKALQDYFNCSPDTQVIYAHGPPFTPFLVVDRFARRTRRKVVFDFRDPWSKDPERHYLFRWMETLVRKLERRILASGQTIVTVTHCLANDFRKLEPACDANIAVITNGFDPEDFPQRTTERKTDKFRLGHAGNLFTRNTEPFLRALRETVKREPRLLNKIEVCFWGPVDPKTQALVKEFLLQPICAFPGVVPHSKWVEACSTVSAFLLFQSYGSIDVGAIPGKLFEYAALRKPILGFGWNGEASELIEKRGWGHYFTPRHTAEEISNTILNLFERWESGEETPYFSDETLLDVSRDTLTRQLEALLTRESKR